MSTVANEVIDNKELAELTKADQEITKIKPYLELRVNGVDDTEGFEKVHKARMEVRTLRTSVEKSRTALKASALAFGRKVDAEAKRIAAMIAPIEEHLIDQEAVVKREKDRLAKIEQDKRDAAIRERLEKLSLFGVHRSARDIEGYSDEEFEWFLKDSEKKYIAKQAEEEAERQRATEEAERNRIESERLKAEREAIEAEQRQHAEELAEQKRIQEEELRKVREYQEAEEKRIRQEREAIEAEKKRLEREEFERQAKIKAETEAREKLEREAKERAEAEERRKIEEVARLEQERIELEEAERQAELMKTDVQRLGDLAKQIEDIKRPEVKSDAAKEIVEKVFKLLDEAVDICV